MNGVTVPGVGRKTAERVVIELRDKIGQLALLDSDVSSAPSTTVDVDATRDDVVAALVSLGYQKALAEKIVAKAAGISPANITRTTTTQTM